MSLTLNATLQTAQDGQSHHPILEIISNKLTADIPFAGQFLTGETTNEQKPNSVTHSIGRLCLSYLFSTDKLKYVYTDTARQTFNFVELDKTDLGIAVTPTMIDCAICELSDNTIGLIYICSYSGSFHLRQCILSATGTVSSNAAIDSFAAATWPTVQCPFFILMANGTYLLTYIKENSSNEYRIYKRTSADFSSWSAESVITPSGWTGLSEIQNASLLQISTDDVFLWFDYFDDTNYSNIYYSISSDNGATWAAAVKNTSYADATAKGIHPIAVQKVADQIHMVFNEERGALHMDKNDTGWKPGAASSEIIEISIDEANRKLYAVNAYQGIGYRPFQCVVKIDMDSWTIDTYWDTSTTPAFSTYFTGNIFMNANRHHGERYYTIVARSAVVDGDMVLAVLNADANTITHYVFLNKPPYSLTKNVDWTPWNPYGSSFYFVWSIWGSHIDFASSRLYIFLRFVIANYCLFDVGYIDLTDPGPTYTYNNILQSTNEIHYLIGQCIRCFKVFPDDGIFIISAGYQGAGRIGYILIYALSSGSLLKKYTVGTHPTCPYWGISNPCMRGGKIYASFTYESGYGQANYRGICEIDINTDTFTYHRPTWATLDDYELRASAVTDDDRIIFSTYGYGMTIFDPDTGVWILYDSTTLPGLSPTGADNYIPVKYDSTTAMVYTGAYGSWDGLVGFSIYGFLKRTYYKIGTFAVSWSFGSANPLVLGQIDYDSVIALDPSDQSIYAFWTNKTLLEFSIKWDKESPSFDLTPYVLRSEEIVTEKSIDGTPNKLIFGLSHGHLFDKYNTNSLLRIYLLKGRALDVRQGENISSVEYWQALGRFYVSETSISGYERGKYPTMRVNAEDIRTIWDDMEIITSEFYENYPETVLNSILTNYADLTGGDLDIPTMDNRVFIYRQYLDTSIADMVKEICDRFGYYPRITVDDKFSCRRISDSNSIDHTYSDLDQIINFSPDDSYSSYINQITIVGEERDFNTIIYPEEPVGYINGTVGWWGHKCDYWVWFSEDHTKKCESPRLEIVESARKILFELAGTITEQIEYIDPNGLYCIVKVDVPDMTWMLLTLLNYYLYYAIYEPDGVVGGVTVPYGRLIEGATLFAMIYILASVTNFQYVVHATPIGEERRTVQATADDTDFQNELGKVVQKRIEDPLCTTQAQCQTVATQEMMEVRLQRNRVRFSKTAHLQEEEGDTIKINHPITGYPMTVFITNLKRRMKLPEGPKGSGHWIDDIEGWKVA